jgi:hypothetical protein
MEHSWKLGFWILSFACEREQDGRQAKDASADDSCRRAQFPTAFFRFIARLREMRSTLELVCKRSVGGLRGASRTPGALVMARVIRIAVDARV